MRLLLDTHMALWWQDGDLRLPREAQRLVEESDDLVYVSRVSLWELAIKTGMGRVRVELPMFADAVESLGFTWLPIENSHILQLANLPVFPDHRDPFDRLLVAQSASEPIVLLTSDAKLRRYGSLVRVV